MAATVLYVTETFRNFVKQSDIKPQAVIKKIAQCNGAFKNIKRANVMKPDTYFAGKDDQKTFSTTKSILRQVLYGVYSV